MKTNRVWMKWIAMLSAMGAFAATMPLMADTGSFGGYTWTYRIVGGGAEIVTNGANIAISPKPSSGRLIIPDMLGGYPVVAIGDYAFRSCASLTGVEIPFSVTSIGTNAFYSCTRLADVVIPDGVASIGQGAFRRCLALTSVSIPESVTSMGSNAFSDCTNLTHVVANQYLCTGRMRAVFNNTCGAITNVVIGEGVTSIASSAFSVCSNMTSVTISDSVTTIESHAFSGCRKLARAKLPETLRDQDSYLRAQVFDGCSPDLQLLYGADVPDPVEVPVAEHPWYENPRAVVIQENLPSQTGIGIVSAFHGQGQDEFLGLTYTTGSRQFDLFTVDGTNAPAVVRRVARTALANPGLRGVAISKTLGIAMTMAYTATPGKDNVMYAFPLADGELVEVAKPAEYAFDSAAFSPDGQYLFSNVLEGESLTNYVKWAVGVANGSVTLTKVGSLSVSGRGRNLAYARINGRDLVFAMVDTGKIAVLDMTGDNSSAWTSSTLVADLPLHSYGSLCVSGVNAAGATPHLTVATSMNGADFHGDVLNVYELTVPPSGAVTASLLLSLDERAMTSVGFGDISDTNRYGNTVYVMDDESTLYFARPDRKLYAAQYSEDETPAVETHTVTFDLGGHGTRIGGGELVQTVTNGYAAVSPEVAAMNGWRFIGWDAAFANVTDDITVAAMYEQLSYWVETETINGITWQYVVSNGVAEVTSGTNSPAISPSTYSGALTLPSTLGGYPVASIGNCAFYGCSGLTCVTIHSGVTHIDGSAFSWCSRLTRVIFLGDEPTCRSGYGIYDGSPVTNYVTSAWMGPTDVWQERPVVLIAPPANGIYPGSTSFEEFNAGSVVNSSLDSLFEFAGAAEDNESEIQYDSSCLYEYPRVWCDSPHTKILRISTGPEPLWRKIDYAPIALAEDGVYVDMLVQFTVTPAADVVVAPTRGIGGGSVYLRPCGTVVSLDNKLLIYLKEDDVAGSTNLMVKANKYMPRAGLTPEKFEEIDVALVAAVEPNTWYRLQVKSYTDSNNLVLFEIKLDGTLLASATSLYPMEEVTGTVFPSLRGKSSTTLEAVGFSGEGKVDDLAFTTTDPSAIPLAVARIEGGASYGSLKEAIEAAQTGDTVTVLADCAVTNGNEGITITKGINLVNNHTITVDGANYAFRIANGTTTPVTLSGTGSIVWARGSGSPILVGCNELKASYGINAFCDGSLVMNGNTLTSTAATARSGNLVKLESGAFTMNGGTINGGTRGVKADSEGNDATCVLTINGGAIVNTNSAAVAASTAGNGSSTVTINGGTFTGNLVGAGMVTIPGSSTARFDRDQSAFCDVGYVTMLSEGWYLVAAVAMPIDLGEMVRGIEILGVESDGHMVGFDVGISYADGIDTEVLRMALESCHVKVYKADSLHYDYVIGSFYYSFVCDIHTNVSLSVPSLSSVSFMIDDAITTPRTVYYFQLVNGDGTFSLESSNMACITRTETENGAFVYNGIVGRLEDFDRPDHVVSEDRWGDGSMLTVAPGETVRFCYDLGKIDDDWFGYGEGERLKVVVATYIDWITAFEWCILDDDVWRDVIPNTGYFDWTAPREEGYYSIGFTHDELISSGRAEYLCGFDVHVVAATPPQTITVDFRPNGYGTFTEESVHLCHQENVIEGDVISAPEVVAYAGWRFIGWSTPNGDFYPPGTTIYANSSTYVAEYEQIPVGTHTVTFDLGGHGTRIGGGELVQTVTNGCDAVAPEVTVDFGWLFAGWSESFSNVTASVSVTALYDSAFPFDATNAMDGVAYEGAFGNLTGQENITWSANGLPEGLTLTAEGTISGTVLTTGMFTFSVTATAPNGASRTIPMSIFVAENPNHRPVMLGMSPTPMPDLTMPGDTLSFSVNASDPDGDSLTYVWLIDGVTNAVNTTGAFTWTPEELDGGTRIVTCLVTDGFWYIPAGNGWTVSIPKWYVSADGNAANAGTTTASPFREIQSAVDAAAEGDVIFVAEGVYEPINTANKRIRVIATGGIDKTIIDGGGTNRCVYVGQSDTSVDYMPSSSTNSWFVGFTICNGRTDTGGAGVCGGRFDNCLIEHCAGTPDSDYWGGGARFAILNNCVLRENRAYAGGGAYWSVLVNCTVVSNTVTSNRGGGGAISSTVKNSIVWGNVSAGNSYSNYQYGTFTYSCTAPSASGVGNICTDPYFTDLANGDYRLRQYSPCLDVGNNAYVVGESDLSGTNRIIDGIVDMGCYEGWVRLPPPEMVNGVSASDGTSIGIIRITWNAAEYARTYRIYRATTNIVGAAEAIGDTSALFFEDETVTPKTTYWYWVRGVNPAGEGEAGAGDFGWCLQPVAFSTNSVAAAMAGVPYSEQLVVTGGSGRYTWRISAEASPPGQSIPAGLAIGTDGVLSGTMNMAGTYVFTVFVMDEYGNGAKRQISLTVQENPDMRTVTFDLGEHGVRSGGGDLLQYVLLGGSATAPAVRGRTGWVFDGWLGSFTNIADSVTVAAKYRSAYADLHVDAISVRNGGLVASEAGDTLAATAGDTLTVSWIVGNTGNPPFSGRMTEYVRFIDAANVSNVIVVATLPFDGTVARDGTVERSAEVTLPLKGMEGEWIVAVETATNPSVYECAGNNVRSGPAVTVAACPLPDLEVFCVEAAPASFMPGDTVTVEYVVANVGVAGVATNWLDRIALEDVSGKRVNLKSVVVGDVDVTNVFECVIPELVSLAGDVRFVVEMDFDDDVVEVEDVANNVARSGVCSLGKRLYLAAASDSVGENVSSGVRFTVRRSGPVDEPLTVTVGNTDAASASAPATVTIPAGSVSTMFTVTPIDNGTVDGPRTVEVSASADGFASVTLVRLTIIDDEVPALTVALDRGSVREGDGVILATVTRELVTGEPLTVYLTGASTSRCSYPSSVVIPAGEASVTFEISVPNNDTAQIAQELTLHVSSSGYTSDDATYTVEDDDVPGVTLSLTPGVVSEGAGTQAIYATLTRSDTNQIAQAVRVRLTASEANQLILPNEITIHPYTMAVRFPIGVVDNALDDGDREVTVNGSIVIESCGCNGQPSNGDVIQAVVGIIDNDGPALALSASPTTMKEGLNPAGYLILSHNSTLTEPLTVRLWVDAENEGEISILATKTINPGETSVSIPVVTLDDGVEDGGKLVSVYVEDESNVFAPASTWVQVSDQNLPDLTVAKVETVASVVAMENFTVSFAVTNTGVMAASRVIPYDVHLVKGANANAISSATLVKIGTLTGGIDVGEALYGTVTLIAPEMPGDYRVAVVLDPDGTISELDSANNTGWSSAIGVTVAYTATAGVDKKVYMPGETVTITGMVFRADGAIAGNVQIDPYVTMNGMRRSLLTTTAADGSYSATFTPTSGEAGNYAVGACYPGVNSMSAQDSFSIIGMKRSSTANVIWDIALGDSATHTMTIQNRSAVPLTGLTAVFTDVPEECGLTYSLPDTIPANGSVTLSMTATADGLTDQVDYRKFYAHLAVDEGLTLDFPLYFHSQAQMAYLRATPTSINTTMTVGQESYVSLTLLNDGKGDSGAISVSLPDVPWMRVVGGGNIENLLSGDSATVTIGLSPPYGLALNNAHNATVVIGCANGNALSFPMRLVTVSDETGGLHIDVTDTLTLTAESSPHVQGAEVSVVNPSTGLVVANGVTDSSGIFECADIPAGKYMVTIYASQHSSEVLTVNVAPGTVTRHTVFLDYQSVSYVWKVVPTEIEDQYTLTLLAEYETNVPVPAMKINVPDEIPDLSEGESYVCGIEIENAGLIALTDVKLSLAGSIGSWACEQVSPDIETLPAKSSQTVYMKFTNPAKAAPTPQLLQAASTGSAPRRLTALTEADLASVAPCTIGMIATARALCGDEGVDLLMRSKNIRIVGHICDLTSVIAQQIGKVFDKWGIGSGDDRDSDPKRKVKDDDPKPGYREPVEVEMPKADCACLLTVLDRTLGWILGWANVPTWVYDVVVALNKRAKDGHISTEDKVELIKDLKDKIAEINEKINKLNEALGYLNDILDIYEACRETIGENKIAEYALKIRERMDKLISIKANLERLVNLINKISTWWKNKTEPKVQATRLASPVAVLSAPGEYDEQNEEEYPAELLQLAEEFIASNSAILDELEAEGIGGLGEFFNVIAEEFEEYVRGGNALAVCSTIRFKLSQTVTMAREAFEGTLTLENGQLFGALADVKLQPMITDTNGTVCNDLFGITDSTRTGFGGMSFLGGDLTLGSGETGSASVLFVPTPNAAPVEPQIYYFGGVLSYYDVARGERISHNLVAIPLQVNPCPYLKFDYFVQRDVYADDPFTPDVVEASMPAELAILIRNSGAGNANKVTIHSMQPEIVENEKGLAATFRLSDYSLDKTALNGATAYLGLKDVALGTIGAHESAVAQWWLTSSIEGHFIGLAASVTHANTWGNPATSLIDPDVGVHKLVRSIVADGDTLPDFLVCDGSDLYGTPNEIYTARGEKEIVYGASVATIATLPDGGEIELPLSLTPARSGWNYGYATIPGVFRYTISRIVRGDGAEISLRNAWITDRTFRDGTTPLLEDRLHIVDEFASDTAQTYTVYLVAKPTDVPEVVAFEGVTENAVEYVARDSVTVVFSKPIDPATFTADDLTLMWQGTNRNDLSSLSPTPADASNTRFTIGNLSALCGEYGRYELTVQCAGIADTVGQLGRAGKSVAWTYATAEVPYVIGTGGVPTHRVQSLDSVSVTFSVPVNRATFTPAALRMNNAVVGSGVTIDPLDESGTRFAISGLASEQAIDGDYMLTVDATAVAGLDGTAGVGSSTVTWTRDTSAPVLESVVKDDDAAGEQRFILTFSEEVVLASLTPDRVDLRRNGAAVALDGISIQRVGDSAPYRYALSGIDSALALDGTYELSFSADGVTDEAGNAASGSKSVSWTVDRTQPLPVADLAISPDGGFSDTDGITYTGTLMVSGTLPEAGLTVAIIAKYASSGETVLMTLPTAGGDSLPAGAFSQNIVMPGTGNATLIVRLTDAAGNQSDTEKNVFVDGMAFTGALTGASADEGVVTTSATLTFFDKPMEADVTLDRFALTRNGEAVALEGVTFAKEDDTTFTLSGLDSLCAEDGVYVLTFNGAVVRKYTSGLLMSGSLVMRWRYENPDREPPTVMEVLFDGETPHEAYTNVFSSVSVTFSEAVNVPELIENGLIGRAARIDLLDVANSVTGSAVIASAMTWDGESNTLSWQIDPLAVPAGRTRLMLDAGLIADLAGNHLAADGYAVTNGMRTYMQSETVLAQVNAQAMPMWYNGELYVGEKTADNKGKIRHYAANGTWSYLQSEGVDIEIPAQGCQGASLAFADMDDDGVAETYVGTATGDVLKYPGGTPIASLGASRAMPYAYDIDGDGCDELVAGGMDGHIRVISRDTATGTYGTVVLADVNGAALTVPNGRAAPIVADINHDGLADIVSGDTAGNVWAYLGEGSAWCAAPITVFTNNVSLADRSRLGYGDVNGDGIEDLIVGRSDGSAVAMPGAETPSPIVPFAVKAVVSASAGTHGAIAPVGDATYDGGDAPEYTITPDVGYHVADVLVDGVSIGSTNSYVFAPLTISHAIHADFVTVPYSITYTGLKGAANTNPETYTVEDAITFAAPGEVYGWVFNGWTPASIALGSTGAIEVTANWERQKFDVTVNGETRQYDYEEEVTFTAPEPTVDELCRTQFVYVGTSYTAPTITNEFTVSITTGFEFAWDILATNYWFETAETQNGSITAPEAGWKPDGDEFTIAAVPAEHYHFTGWTGDTNGCVETNDVELVVTMDEARTIGATFAIDVFTVRFDLGEYGTLATGELVQTVAYGSAAIAPTLIVDDCYVFDGWDVAFDNVTSDIVVAARYHHKPPVTLTVAGVPDGATEYSHGNGTTLITYGDTVAVSVQQTFETANTSIQECAGWFGTGSVTAHGYSASTNITMKSDSSITWIWNTTKWWLETSAENGSVSVPSGWQTAGSTTELTAMPSAHYHFTGWTGTTNGCEVSGSALSVPMDGIRSIVANFEIDSHKVSIDETICDTIPSAGELDLTYGSMVTVEVVNAVINCGATQYVCKGWSATNADPVSGEGARAVFRVLGDVALDWQWETNVVTLAQSVNADGLDWTTGGAADWQPEWSDAANDGLHHAHSGAIGNNTNSWIETSVDGAGTLSFVWKSSTEARYDMFQLIVDGEVKGAISGETPWTTNTIVLAGGAHTFRWNYRKSRSGTTGADTVWLDSVTWTADVPPTLAEALNPDLFWMTDGDIEWTAVRKNTILDPHDDWATVGGLSDYESSLVGTEVYGAGVLTFDWAVSCEDGYDWFDFIADGEIRESITGETGWKTVTIEFKTAGKHVLQWEYWKDDMDEAELVGDNRARLDNVKWTPVSVESQYTTTTPDPIPFAEIRTSYSNYWQAAEGDYEAAAHMTGRNGYAIWQSYLAGLIPDNEKSKFKAKIDIVDGETVITWEPDTPELRATRVYRTFGKKMLLDANWTDITDKNKSEYRFFKVTVELP